MCPGSPMLSPRLPWSLFVTSDLVTNGTLSRTGFVGHVKAALFSKRLRNLSHNEHVGSFALMSSGCEPLLGYNSACSSMGFFPGFGVFQYVALSRGLGLFLDVAFPGFWSFPGCGISRMWHVPGCGTAMFQYVTFSRI